MQSSSEAIKEAPEITEISDRAQEVINIIGEIDEQVDSKVKLERVRVYLASLAASADEEEVDEDRVARELAHAFATIEEYRYYLPARFYTTFADWTADIYSYANWQSDPDVARIVGPHILQAAIKKLAAKESC